MSAMSLKGKTFAVFVNNGTQVDLRRYFNTEAGKRHFRQPQRAMTDPQTYQATSGVNATARAIELAIANWHVAGWKQIVSRGK